MAAEQTWCKAVRANSCLFTRHYYLINVSSSVLFFLLRRRSDTAASCLHQTDASFVYVFCMEQVMNIVSSTVFLVESAAVKSLIQHSRRTDTTDSKSVPSVFDTLPVLSAPHTVHQTCYCVFPCFGKTEQTLSDLSRIFCLDYEQTEK